MYRNSINEIKEYINETRGYLAFFNVSFVLDDKDCIDKIKRMLFIAGTPDPKELLITADCLFWSIFLGEYESAKRIIKEISDDCILSRSASISGFEINSMQIFLTELLYSDVYDIPGDLRCEFFEKVNELIPNGAVSAEGYINIGDIRRIYDPVIQDMIIRDYSAHPGYFDYGDYPRTIEEIGKACFLMKLYKDEPEKIRMLMTERTEITMEGYFSVTVRYMRSEFEMLKSSFEYSWMEEYRAILSAWLTELYSVVEREAEDDYFYWVFEDEMEKVNELKLEIGQFIKNIATDEKDYLKSIELSKKTGMRAFVNSYILAKSVIGKKPELIIDPERGADVEDFFGITSEYTEDERRGKEYYEERRVLLTKLSESIGSIRYEYSKSNVFRLVDIILIFLYGNADILKDPFPLFVEKGLIPEEYLEEVIRRVKRHKQCAYMVPILTDRI
ncbi:MAG: hypothetical protein K6B28_13700 [Lachnospiraceae bacterium]|nr:hypothetical protein [Lachnospiraceae bacterium]